MFAPGQCRWAWAVFLIQILALISQTAAYRPVQHCKHDGENGHYSACTSLTTTENSTTGHLDLYIRYQWYRYESSNIGWHAIALGREMAGAHMLIMYGDPTASDGAMTVSVRTADGHHPPRPMNEFSQFEGHDYPKVDIRTAKFIEYTGFFIHQESNKKPTHMGVMEAVIPSFALWPGTKVEDSSDRQPMLWSSNSRQNFENDYSDTRSIEMHAYGIGFGYMWTDLKNAKTPVPMFGPIDESAGSKGVNEVRDPDPPTPEELQEGEKYIISITGTAQSASPTAEEHPSTDAPDSNIPSDDSSKDNATGNDANNPPLAAEGEHPPEVPQQDDHDSIQQPARTILGKTLRDWMWHLHGLIMCFAFLVLYPLGTYLLRRPPTNGNGFNSHWTIQALASVAVLIGAVIGYLNSHSISITHQYVGILMIMMIAVQIFMGWRHHVVFIASHRRTVFSKAHKWTGRVILPLGFFNIISGMLLRQYGWLTLILVLVLVVLESSFLTFVLTTTRNTRTVNAGHDTGIAMRDEEAEEYFQLGEEDDDDWSDDDQKTAEGHTNTTSRMEDKRKQAERLAKLDKV